MSGSPVASAPAGLRRACALLLRALVMAAAVPAASSSAQSVGMQLAVPSGTPLRVALERRVIIERVGQPVEAVVIDPVFAVDRIVIPAGTRVKGHVTERTPVSKKRRALAMLGGDFTPLHDIRLRFDTLVLAGGQTMTIDTQVAPGTEQVSLVVAEGEEKTGNVATRAVQDAVGEVRHTLHVLRAPGKTERMKDAGLRALPYHPEFFSMGTVFSARLQSALDFGLAASPAFAEAGTAPAPDSVISARLITPLDSGHATKGAPVEAVLTRPVFTASHEVIVPAGARLTGHVTFVTRARRFRRNGQLRFLFDTVHVAEGDPMTLLASLSAVEAGHAARVSVDDEGGATVTNSPARFVAPALGTLALVGLAQGHLDYDTDGAGPEMQYGGPVSGSVAGAVGASVTGLAVASLGHPAAVALGVLGVARTTYAAVIAKGREVVFPADTPILVVVAPGSSHDVKAP